MASGQTLRVGPTDGVFSNTIKDLTILSLAVHKDWRVIARRHWSVRWWGAAIILEFVNAFLPSAQPYLPAQVNPLWVSLAIGLCGAAGLACKFIAQKDLPNAAD